MENIYQTFPEIFHSVRLLGTCPEIFFSKKNKTRCWRGAVWAICMGFDLGEESSDLRGLKFDAQLSFCSAQSRANKGVRGEIKCFYN